jgi:hypothetical protein
MPVSPAIIRNGSTHAVPENQRQVPRKRNLQRQITGKPPNRPAQIDREKRRMSPFRHCQEHHDL